MLLQFLDRIALLCTCYLLCSKAAQNCAINATRWYIVSSLSAATTALLCSLVCIGGRSFKGKNVRDQFLG